VDGGLSHYSLALLYFVIVAVVFYGLALQSSVVSEESGHYSTQIDGQVETHLTECGEKVGFLCDCSLANDNAFVLRHET